MKAVRFKCTACGLAEDIPLDSTFDNQHDRTIQQRILVENIFDFHNRRCKHCDEPLQLVGIVET